MADKFSLPKLPATTLPIFKLPPPHVDERGLIALASRLGIEADPREARLSRVGERFVFGRGSLELSLHRASGYFRLINRALWQVDRGAHLEIGDDDAARLAREHLASASLLPSHLAVRRVSRLNVAVSGPDRSMQDHRVIDVAVHIQPVLHELPVEGPGEQIVVTLDHEHTVTSLTHNLRAVGKVYRETKGLRGPDDALAEARLRWEAAGARRIEPVEMRLCYWELAADFTQTYLQPAYFVRAILYGPDERFRTGAVAVIPADVDPVEPIEPAPRPRAPEQPRAVQES